MAHYLPYFEGLSYLCLLCLGCSAASCGYALYVRRASYAVATGLLVAIYVMLFITLKVLEGVLR